jgi:hypothetical protein
MRTLGRACLLAFMCATTACSTVGHNETFMFQYKKDLRDRYVGKEGSETSSGGTQTTAAGSGAPEVASQLALQSVYRSNLPLSLTDKYDTRGIRLRRDT